MSSGISHYYIVEAQIWGAHLRDKFGGNGEGLHLLTDAEVIDLIMEHGPADIRQETDHRVIEFQNTYN